MAGQALLFLAIVFMLLWGAVIVQDLRKEFKNE